MDNRGHDPSHLFLRVDRGDQDFSSYPSVASRAELKHIGVTCAVCE